MWRAALPQDDDALVEMSLELYREDHGLRPIAPSHTRRTLAALRDQPSHGRAVILEVDGQPVGYALLISFWSNELGGELCEVDELFVRSGYRSRGHGEALFDAIERGDVWPASPVAIALGVTLGNTRARRMYERVGFLVAGLSMIRSR